MLTSVLAFFLVLGVLIVLHEAGHFVAARLLGAPVEVFSVGFGKRLWGFERGGTDYRVSLIPFGGYVRVVGLGPDESDVASAGSEPEPDLLPRWKRAVILVAGPLTNIAAAVLFLAFAFTVGVETPAFLEQPPVVGWVDPESPAAAADIEHGDIIRSVDGVKMPTWRELDMALLTAGGREIALEVERDGTTRTVRLTPEAVSRYQFGYSGLAAPLEPVVVQLVPGQPAARAGLEPGDRILAIDDQPVEQFYDLIRLISPRPNQEMTLQVERGEAVLPITLTSDDVGGEGRIGIALVYPTELRKLGPVAAVGAGVTECVRITKETFRVLGRLFARKASMRQLSGPIDIARISGEAAKSGFHTLIRLMGLISLQLGIFNLLPIPILDGGHLTIIAFESTIRRDLPVRVKERILEVGFYALILLFAFVMFNDIVKILPDSVYNLIFKS
jgi:regulator of sigma E protease